MLSVHLLCIYCAFTVHLLCIYCAIIAQTMHSECTDSAQTTPLWYKGNMNHNRWIEYEFALVENIKSG